MVDNDSIFRSHCVKLGLGIYGFSLKTNAAIKEENILTSFICLLRIKRLIWIKYLECHYSYYFIFDILILMIALLWLKTIFLVKEEVLWKSKNICCVGGIPCNNSMYLLWHASHTRHNIQIFYRDLFLNQRGNVTREPYYVSSCIRLYLHVFA